MSKDIVQLNQEVIHSELKELVKNSIEETLNALLDSEADRLVNAERYVRDEQRQGYRSGHYERNFTTSSGDITLRMQNTSDAQSIFTEMSCLSCLAKTCPKWLKC